MKYINKIGMMVVASIALATTSCTEFSDYNEVQESSLGTGSKTIWENIKSNSELSQFAAIVEKAGYVDQLNSSRFVTVWAPKNGSFNADSVLNLQATGDILNFIKHHTADYAHRTMDNVNDSVVYTLNKKRHIFFGNSFGRTSVFKENIASSNGVLHILNSNDPYYKNVYEFVDNLEGCNKFTSYIKKFDRKILDKAHSVIGPIVDGKQTYLDSVVNCYNEYYTDKWYAHFENEDSLYTLLIPTDEAWDQSFERIKPLMKYPTTASWFSLDSLQKKNTTWKATTSNISASKSEALSQIVKQDDKNISDAAYLQDSLTIKEMMRSLAFNMHNSRNKSLFPKATVTKNDTLVPTSSNIIKLSNVNEILESTVGSPVTLSNGYARIVNNIAINPWETYNKVLTYSNSSRCVNSTGRTDNITMMDMTADRMALFADLPRFVKKILFPEGQTKFRWAYTNPAAQTSSPEMDFALRDVMATKYRILVVTLPSQIVDPNAPVLEQQLQFIIMNLKETEEEGVTKVVSEKIGGTTGIPAMLWKEGAPFIDETANGKLTLPGGKANLIDLGEYSIPFCCENAAYYPSLMITNSISTFTSSNRSKYEQRIRIAKVILIPTDRYNSLLTEE